MQEEWDYARYGPGLHERDPRLRSVARVFLLLLGAGLAGRAATKLRPLPYCDSSDQTDRGLPPCTPCPFKGTCQRGELLHCGSGYELRRGRCSPTSDLVLLASDIADRYSRVIWYAVLPSHPFRPAGRRQRPYARLRRAVPSTPVVQEGCSFIAPAQDGVGDTPSMADALHGTGLPEALLHEPNASAAASEAVALATLALTGGGGVDADLLTVQPAARGSGDEFLDDMTPGAARQLRRLRARFGAAHPGCDAFRPLLCSVLPGGRSTRQVCAAPPGCAGRF